METSRLHLIIWVAVGAAIVAILLVGSAKPATAQCPINQELAGPGGATGTIIGSQLIDGVDYCKARFVDTQTGALAIVWFEVGGNRVIYEFYDSQHNLITTGKLKSGALPFNVPQK